MIRDWVFKFIKKKYKQAKINEECIGWNINNIILKFNNFEFEFKFLYFYFNISNNFTASLNY